jgi:hypothetical protein
MRNSRVQKGEVGGKENVRMMGKRSESCREK